VDIGLSMNIGIAESPGNTIWGSLCLTYNYIATEVLPKLEPFL
jgi:hypothetical protein